MSSPHAMNDAPYFMLECFLENEEAMLSGDPDDFDPDLDWYAGAKFHKSPSLPVRMVIYEGQAGSGVLPEQNDVPVPVMSRRLMKVLLACGVSNIDFYDAVIVDEASKAQHISHVAYNLIGVVAAADLDKTRFSESTGSRLIDADIESLVIDTSKPRKALMFRLAESVNGIVVHECVKVAIEAAGIDTLTFLPPEEWIG